MSTSTDKEKIILITGASSGIGAAVAIKAAELGHNVCINYSSNQVGAEKVKDKALAHGVKAITVQADIGTEKGVAAIFEAVDDFGQLSALVNNAGIITPISSFEAIEYKQLERLFAINVFGSFLCAKEAVKRLRTDTFGPGGCIVNISSMAARLGSPNEFIDYAASKGAIDTMTIGLAKEVANVGIRVNAVRPGLIDTEIHAHAGDADRVEKFQQKIPMGRGGSAEEVANSVLWLISEQASYTTGSFIDVSGGR